MLCEHHEYLFVGTGSAVVCPIHLQKSRLIRDHRHEFGLEDQDVFNDLLRTAVRDVPTAEVRPAGCHHG